MRRMKSDRQGCLLLLAIIQVQLTMAQARWDGEAGDGQWNNALNWTNNSLPGFSSDVVLDNSIVTGSYSVSLPPGEQSITIRTLLIDPSGGNTIALVLPNTSTVVPGLTISGPGYGMILNRGAVFRNSSGAAAGNGVMVADSVRINNGGRFIHNTARTHAAIVQALSAMPGTEEGIFEFDVPLASTTVGLSGRIFGKLVFAVPAAGTINYTASGINSLKIRSDLELKDGVRLSLNLDDTVFIKRDFRQGAGSLNLSSSMRNAVLNIEGNIYQDKAGSITQTGSGTAEIRVAGGSVQELNMQGTILNAVAFKMEGTGGAILKHGLILPYKLLLAAGILTTSSDAVLVLGNDCGIEADKNSSESFVDGPLRKQGLFSEANFLFPVGKGRNARWLELKNATGNFLVEYFNQDPHVLGGSVQGELDHISSIEYWSVRAEQGVEGTTAVELSFRDPNSGGVTDLADLRVARFEAGSWISNGNTATTGSAGNAGSVTGEALMIPGTGETCYFTLASISSHNPLPLGFLHFKASTRNGNGVLFEWEVQKPNSFVYFNIQASENGRDFFNIATKQSIRGQWIYDCYMAPGLPAPFYRLQAVGPDSTVRYSKVIILKKQADLKVSQVREPGTGLLQLYIDVPEHMNAQILVFDRSGNLIGKKIVNLDKGGQLVVMDGFNRRKEVLYAALVFSDGKRITIPVIL
jgi:hypothetical protein